MSAASVVTLIGVAILVLALAAYLTIIALLLRKVSFHLGTILIGVRAIAHQCEPIGSVVGDIAADVEAIQKALEGVLAKAGKGADKGADKARSPKTAPAPSSLN